MGILHCPICISSYDLFADVTLWDVYEASPESALKDIMHNEIEIDNVEGISPKIEFVSIFLF